MLSNRAVASPRNAVREARRKYPAPEPAWTRCIPQGPLKWPSFARAASRRLVAWPLPGVEVLRDGVALLARVEVLVASQVLPWPSIRLHWRQL